MRTLIVAASTGSPVAAAAQSNLEPSPMTGSRRQTGEVAARAACFARPLTKA